MAEYFKSIKKRNGQTVSFDEEKIAQAIFKAAQSVGGSDIETARKIAKKVVFVVRIKFDSASDIPSVEQIQDIVEKVLIEEGHAKTAKAYILYRQQQAKIREMKDTFIDVEHTINEYLRQDDWRVNENSNEAYSFSGLLLHTAGKVIANYALTQIYPQEVSDAYRKGHIHIHDLSHGFIGYCAGWSLKDLLIRGFGGVANKVDAKPAKHLGVVVHQMVNFIGCLQMEFAGAQAFSSTDTLLAPFVRTDNLDYKQVKQCMQELVYSLNIPSRWGSQYPFSNLTFDWTVPEDMREEKAIVGGKEQEFTYGDLQKEVDMVNKAFLEVMQDGDANGRIFTFPIPTYNLTKSFNWDSENAKLLFDVTAKYGIPYFQNYVGSDLDPKSIRAMCLHPEEELLIKKDGIIEKTSIGELSSNYALKFDFDGWSELSAEIKVMSLNQKTLKLEWKPIKNIVKTAGNEMVVIKTRDGKSIRVTPTHPVSVLTPQGITEKPAVSLSSGEFLFSVKSAETCLSSEQQKIGLQEIDEEMAKLLGFFIADGNFLYENRKNISTFGLEKGMQFTFPSNKNYYADEIITLAEKKFGVNAKTRKDPRYNAFYAYFYNSQISRELAKAGLKKYGKIPPQIWNSPKYIIESFLNGFFLGDGYEKRGEIHINDPMLARELVLLYHLIGKPVTFRERENSQVITVQHGKERMLDNRLGSPPLYEKVPSWEVNTYKVPGLYNTRKVGLMTLQYYGAHTELTKKLGDSNVYPIEITNVEKVMFSDEIFFFDIELEENHRFVHSLGTITHNCCRLNMDTSQLINRPGGMWGPGDATGSIGVITINMNRIGFEAKQTFEKSLSKNQKDAKEEFFEKLEYYMNLAKTSLEIKRKIINKNLKNNLMPFTKAYLGTFDNHFSTIGLCGMNEACVNFLGKDIASEEGKNFAIEVLTFMRNKCFEFQKETKNLYNLEATPAESASYRLARLDKKFHPEIYTAGKDNPYLTNSSQLPVGHTEDAITAIMHQNEIQPLYTGGTIFHTFLGEKVSDGEACKQLVKKIAENTKLPYYSITPTFSVCPVHGYVKGEHFQCPHEIAESSSQSNEKIEVKEVVK